MTHVAARVTARNAAMHAPSKSKNPNQSESSGFLQGLRRRFARRAGTRLHGGQRRAVITGIGVVSPIGMGVDAFWDGLLHGRTGMRRIQQFDPSQFGSQIAAEVDDQALVGLLSEKENARFNRVSRFAVGAFRMAQLDAGLSRFDPDNTDVVIGATAGTLEAPKDFQAGDALVQTPGPEFLREYFMHAPACAIALLAETRGYVTTVSTACPSAINAVGVGAERIEDGRADVVICGGADAPITPAFLQAYCAADWLAVDNEHPTEALCPFDLRRTRAALGEGAALFILEDEGLARARGATIYCHVERFVQEHENVNEKFSMDLSGRAWAQALQRIMRDAGSIDMVNAHGPSDQLIDRVESVALLTALGKRAGRTPVSSIKGAVGSGMASAGAFQIAAAAMTIRTGELPPTYNYLVPDPDCEIRCVKSREHARVNRVLVSAHGLGGVNSLLLLGRI